MFTLIFNRPSRSLLQSIALAGLAGILLAVAVVSSGNRTYVFITLGFCGASLTLAILAAVWSLTARFRPGDEA